MSARQTPNASQTNLKVVKTETKPNGESIQLVRPYAKSTKSTDEIVGDLVNNFSYRTMPVKAANSELSAVEQAFGSSLARELIKTYDGSNLVSDSQQDLVGERYLAEQIKLIEQQQKNSSVLNKWSHLLYEGEKYTKNDINQMHVLSSVTEDPSSYQGETQSAASIPTMFSHVVEQPVESQASYLEITEDIINDLTSHLNNERAKTQTDQSAANREHEQRIKEVLDKIKAESDMRNEQQQQDFFKPRETQQSKEVELEEHTTTINFQEEPEYVQPSNIKKSSSQHVQQPAEYLPKLSSSNLNNVSLEAYNSPQFKAMLDQLLKPMTLQPEEINYPAEWPSSDKIHLLAEPIYIPSPLPIVVPAPNLKVLDGYKDFPEELTKPIVTHYPAQHIPTISSDQAHFQNFGIRQLNL